MQKCFVGYKSQLSTKVLLVSSKMEAIKKWNQNDKKSKPPEKNVKFNYCNVYYYT